MSKQTWKDRLDIADVEFRLRNLLGKLKIPLIRPSEIGQGTKFGCKAVTMTFLNANEVLYLSRESLQKTVWNIVDVEIRLFPKKARIALIRPPEIGQCTKYICN